MNLPALSPILILGLVCFRLTQLLVYDEGPFDVFLRIRRRVGVYDLGQDGRSQTELGKALSCAFCTGLWVAAPLAAIAHPEGAIEFFITWFAIASVQAVLEYIEGDDGSE